MSPQTLSDDAARRKYAELMNVPFDEVRALPIMTIRKHLDILADQEEAYREVAAALYGDDAQD